MKRVALPERKKLLGVGKLFPEAIKELMSIRGDATTLSESLDAYSDSEKAIKLMKKKKATLLVSTVKDTHLVIGRVFNNEFIDLIKFRIVEMKSTKDFGTVSPHLFMKYAVLIQNVEDERLENLVVDLLAVKTREVALNALLYTWVFSWDGDAFTLKYMRIRDNCEVEDVGPSFRLTVEKEYHCGSELWKKAFPVKKAKKKNVKKSGLKEEVGKVYIDKQDLRDVRLRKIRGHKKRAEMLEK